MYFIYIAYRFILLFFIFINFNNLTLASSSPSNSGSATVNLQVTTNVIPTCSITAGPLAFGNYELSQLDTTASITVTCSSGTAYEVGLSSGAGPAATTSTRKMVNSSNGVLNYFLYRDSGRTLNWGNTSGVDTVSGIGNSQTQNLPVYGRIPAGQQAPVGAYGDTIDVLMTFQ